MSSSSEVQATPVDGVLFDFGHTLFGHLPLDRTVAIAAEQIGNPLDPQHCSALAAEIDAAAMDPAELAFGRDLDAEVWRRRWAALYGRADRVDVRLGAAIDRLMHDPAQWHPYAATARVLARLRAAGICIGVVSNTGWDVRAVFDHHELGGLIDVFVLSCEVAVAKPDPAIFRLAAQRLRVAAPSVVMVGDDVLADGAAVRAGMRVVLLPVAPAGADNGLDLIAALAYPSKSGARG